MKRVEIPALGHSTISGSLRAYQTCGEWLKKVIKVDLDVTGISVLQSPCWKELKENIRIWSRRLKIGKAHLLPSTAIKALIKVWADLRMPHNTGQHILYPLLNKGAEQWDPALYYQCPYWNLAVTPLCGSDSSQGLCLESLKLLYLSKCLNMPLNLNNYRNLLIWLQF